METQYVKSPLIRTNVTISRIMWDVVIALVPTLIAGIVFFGIPALWVVFLSTVTAVLCEALILRYPLYNKGIFGDGSSIVTGLILGLILPPTVSWWMPIVGSIFAIALVKLAFGGLGYNIFNPAIAARTILLLGFTAHMVIYTAPFDVVTTATPLLRPLSFDWSFIWGNYGGSIGETSVIAILLGGIYLLYRGHIDWRIPTGYVGTAFLFAVLWGIDPWATITTGGLLFAAVFMATDMVTSPVTPMGRLIFGIGCGFLTIFLRQFTAFPEGVSFAVLVMNAIVPILDKMTLPIKFGAEVSLERRTRTTITVAVIILLSWGALALVSNFTPEYRPVVAEGVYLPLEETLQTADYEKVDYKGTTFYYVGELDKPERVAFTSDSRGYHGPIHFYVVVDAEGVIEHIQILSHRDDPGLGSLVTRESFLGQFIGKSPEDEISLGVDVQGITGATISSNAVIRGVREGLENYVSAFLTEEEKTTFADGTYIGEVSSFGGNLQVEVVVSGGKISQVKVLKHNDTPGIADQALELIPKSIVANNSTDVDTITYATVTSKAIMKAVEKALATDANDVIEVTGAPLEVPTVDGIYQGTGTGYKEGLEVEVTVEGGKIVDITVVSHNDTPLMANVAFKQLIPAIIETQGLVDAYTSATASSEGLFAAIEDAFTKEAK